MARITKDCPSCGGKQPCTITLVPPEDFQPEPHHNEVTYVVTCNTCGHEYDPDSTEIVSDARKWAAENRPEGGGPIL
jgi:hypothetical protein